MNDILLAAGPGSAVEGDDVIDVFKAICAHHPAPHVIAA